MLKNILILSLIFSLPGCSDKENAEQPSSPVKNIQATPKSTPPTKLDLSLPPTSDLLPDNDFEHVENQTDSSFIIQKSRKEKRVNIGGKIIRDDSNSDYIESVEGAEISVEIKIP